MNQTAFAWVTRHFIWFLLIVAILVAGQALSDDIVEFKSDMMERGNLRKARTELEVYWQRGVHDATARARRLGSAADSQLVGHLGALDAEIHGLSLIRGHSALRPTDALSHQGVNKVKAHLKMELLKKERAYVHEILLFGRASRDMTAAKATLEELRQVHQRAYRALSDNESERDALMSAHRFLRWVPMTQTKQKWTELDSKHAVLLRENLAAARNYEQQELAIKRVPQLIKPDFAVSGENAFIREIGGIEQSLETRLKGSWLDKLVQPLTSVLPSALAIMAGILLVPLVVKTLLYYLVAPLAAKRPALCLLPEANGSLHAIVGGELRTQSSAVSQSVELVAGQELLVHPEYLQSTADAGTKDTQWLLDWSIPLSSIASGMVALTRIRSGAKQSFVISATKDPLSEIGLIEVPEGGAVVFQPRSLIGIVQSIDRPVRITRHWRLLSLSAWLTLQLRYLIFHGPVTLLVKGCRGIRVEPAEAGRSINQAATLGFSANVGYSVRRLETFMPYVTGKQELFNDNFAGGPGYCIYEEVPDAARKGGVTGRGIEGLVDSALKVFGI